MRKLLSAFSGFTILLALFAIPLLATMRSAGVPEAFAACSPVSSANLMGHWKFDEGTGTTTADSSGTGHTGTLENGPAWTTGTPAITPNPAALSFDGSNDLVRVSNSNDLRFNTGSFAISLFLRVGTGSTNRAVLGNYNGSSRGWGLFLPTTNQVNFFAEGNMGTNDANQSGTGVVANDQWHHLAGVFSRSGSSLTIRTYLDGTLLGTSTSTVGNISSSSDVLFGDFVGQTNFQGRLDDIRIYGRELSGAEVSSLSQGCNGTTSSTSSSSLSSSTGSSLSSSSSSSSTGSSLSSSSSSTSVSSTSSSTGSSVSSSSISSSASSVSSACTSVSLSGLVGYWRFDAGTGTIAIDSTSYKNTGSLLNGAGWSSTHAPTLFTNPFALSLDGTNDYVHVEDTTNFPSGSTARTISLWIHQDAITNQATLVSLGTGSNANQKFIVQMGTSGGQTYLFTDGVNGSNNITLTGSHIPTTGAWHHIAFTFSGGTWRYYLDGVQRRTGTFPVAINTVTNDVEIGARHDLVAGFFDGLLDDVRLYNRALSASEVANLAGGCNGPVSSSSASSTGSSVSSISTSSSVSSVSSSSASSVAGVPTCNGMAATVYVSNGRIVGGRWNGRTYHGTLRGGDGNDVIVGTSGRDRIRGRDGDDTICGLGGDDRIRGGDGNDWIDGGDGEDDLHGDDDADTVKGGNGDDDIDGRDGSDVLCAQGGNDDVDGDDGSDQIDGGAGTDDLNGGDGNDVCRNGEGTLRRCETTGPGSIAQCA